MERGRPLIALAARGCQWPGYCRYRQTYRVRGPKPSNRYNAGLAGAGATSCGVVVRRFLLVARYGGDAIGKVVS